MNPGRTVPAQQPPNPSGETTRQWISDVDAQIVADAYGYSVVLPSTIDTAHATFDSQTGTLLVQGRAWAQTDTITIDTQGTNIRIRVNSTTELFPTASVSQIFIAQNGGGDAVNVFGIAVPVNQVQYVVSSNQDSDAAGPTGDYFVDLSTVIPGQQVALRAAIIDANGSASPTAIYVPRGNYGLTLTGAGGDAQGDLEINRSITIIGTGAGESVIDAGPLRLTNSDRVFDVSSGGTLSLYSLTVTGGRAPTLPGSPAETHGGGIYARNGGTLITGGVAIVGNETTDNAGDGGGIYFASAAGGVIRRSVITGNHARNFTGGIFLANGSPAAGVYIGNTIITLNTSTNYPTSAGPDVLAQAPNRQFFSEGGNRLGNTTTGLATNANIDDFVGTPNYVVTGIADTFNHADDTTVRSLREAIDSANGANGQTIWAPPWNFILTRQRTTTLAQGDVNTSHGDLDIVKSMTINGGGGGTSVRWRTGIVDAVFDLIGDFNGDGIASPDDGQVSGTDFNIWQQTLGSTVDLRADADDNGKIEGADKDLWTLYFNNTLTLTNFI